MALTDELGYQLAQLRKIHVLDRFRDGAQAIQVPVMRSATAHLRAGDWVNVNLSWFPDSTASGPRRLVMRAQIVAAEDLDCAWRRFVFEDEAPQGYS